MVCNCSRRNNQCAVLRNSHTAQQPLIATTSTPSQPTNPAVNYSVDKCPLVSLSLARLINCPFFKIHFTPHSHRRLGLINGFLLSNLHIQTLNIFFSHTRATYPCLKWKIHYFRRRLQSIRLQVIPASFQNINPLKTKSRQLYLKTQFVPRSKHFISVIKTNQFML